MPKYKLLFPQGHAGLTPLGRAAVDAMIDNHVLVDITHMSEASIADTFDLLKARDAERRIPVLASHVACRMNGLDYNLSDETISGAADRKGVLGVIDCQHYIEVGLRETEPFRRLIRVDLHAHQPHPQGDRLLRLRRDRIGPRRLRQAGAHWDQRAPRLR